MSCDRWINMDMGSDPAYTLPPNPFMVTEIRYSNISGIEEPAVQLLAIKPEVEFRHTGICLYEKTQQTSDKHCLLISPEQWAHLHVTSKNGEDGVLDRKHYIIVFAERRELGEADVIFDKFYNTITWFKIKNKSLGFRVFYFGFDGYNLASTVVDNNTATSTFEGQIKDDIKKNFGKNKHVECYVRAAIENLGEGKKDEQAASNEGRRKPTILTIERYTDAERGPYKFCVA
jgi:hypothetical protein